MDVVSKLHVHRGLRKSRKLCFNLCSIKWNRPNQSLLATATQHDCGYNCNPTWLWILIVSKCNSQIKLIMWCYICYRYIKFVWFIHSALQLKNAIFALFLVTKMSNAGIRSWKYFGDFRLIENFMKVTKFSHPSPVSEIFYTEFTVFSCNSTSYCWCSFIWNRF